MMKKMFMNLNWRFDIWHDALFDIQQFSSTLIVEITCQLRFFCFFIDYFIFYLFFFVFVFFSFFVFIMIFVFFSAFTSASSASTIICSNIYARVIEASLKALFEKLHEELLEKLNEKFLRIACLFSLWSWIYDKRYMLWTHATINFLCRECIIKILVVEAFIWRERSSVIVSTWNSIDSSILSTRFDIFIFITLAHLIKFLSHS